jgi:hypothetical protein
MSNAMPSLVDGLKKRPPSKHVGKLNTNTDTDSFVHVINRDESERYVVVVKSGNIEVYDLDGVSQTVAHPDGETYLACSSPNTEIAMYTVADTTFVVNKTKTVLMDSATVGGSLTGTVQTFADLPASPSAGNVYKIEGDPSNNFDNYYVQYDGTAATWVETQQPGSYEYKFDPNTMPHKLVRTSSGNFTFEEITWADRSVGDTTSSPEPSFVGKKIVDVFLHKNRLGLLADENVILSTTPASDFRFWRESATTIIDSDPIDLSVSGGAGTNSVSLLNHAIAFDKSLLLFSRQTQFILSGNPTLSPSTAAVDVTTEFEASAKARPVGSGPNVYFPTTRGNSSGIREYFVEDNIATNDAADVTAHVPTYIPDNVFRLISSSNEDILFALTEDAGNELYVYKYYWQGNEKVQSAWGKWTFASGDVILGGEMIHNTLYLIVKRSDGTYLDSVELTTAATDTGLSFLVHLDRRNELTGVYHAGNDETTWTLPYADTDTYEVILGTAFTNQAGRKLTVTHPTSTTIVADGDFSAGACFVGKPYTFSYQFSQQFKRDAAGAAVAEGRLMMRRMTVIFTDTGNFVAKVTPEARSTYEYPFTGKYLGTNIIVGAVSITDGTFAFPVMDDAEKVTIVLENDSHLPCNFQSAEWTGLYHSHAFR